MIVEFRPVRGCTLHIPGTGPDHDKARGHLFVILTETCQNGLNLLVPIATARGKSDRTCLLGLGDHPFISHPSYVQYARLEFYEAEVLRTKVLQKTIQPQDPFGGPIFARVCLGVAESRYAAPKFKLYYSEQTARPMHDGSKA